MATKRPIVVIHRHSQWLSLTENWLYHQIRHLPPEVESHIVCDRTMNLALFRMPNIHCLRDGSHLRYYWDKGLRRLQLRPYLGYLLTQARRHQSDIVHTHFGNEGWSNRGIRKKLDIKYVVTFYGFDVNYLPRSHPRWYHRYQQLFAEVDRVLCEGPYMAQSIINLGCPPEKVRVHYLGVVIDKLAYRPRKWDSGLPLRILIAASFNEKKGIPYALEALGRIQHEVSLEITIIGDAAPDVRSKQEKKKILEVVQKHNLGPMIRMLGYQPYSVLLTEAYRHHIFLSPSITALNGDTEGGAPVSIIEMMATGMLIVSSYHCDIPEIVRNGETGLLSQERDVDGLVQNLRWLVEHPAQWEPMLMNSRKHVEEAYNAHVQGQQLADIYRELVEE